VRSVSTQIRTTQRRKHPVQIAWYHSLSSLEPYRDAWNALAAGVPFRSWTWLSTWWRHYGGDGDQADASQRGQRRQLRVALVLDSGIANGAAAAPQLVGVLPCYVAPTLVHGRVLRLLGDGEVCSDHVGVIAKSDHGIRVADALAEFLAADSEWDLADFTAVDDDDLATNRLFAALAERRCDVAAWPDGNTWAIDLPTVWEEFLALQSKSHRKQLRQAERRVLDGGDAKWNLVREAAEFDVAWATLTDLHQRRRKSLGEPGCFSWPSWAAFHRDVAAHLHAEGRLRLSTLELDCQPVAAEYHFAGTKATYAYQGGVDPGRLADEPGRLSTIRTIQHALGEGHARFDFLRGDESYKAHWRAVPRPTWRRQATAPRRWPKLRRNAWAGARRVGQWARQFAGMFS
jgi:hypothetical protein